MKNRLKDIRKQKGLNQAEVAKLLGITQASYSHYETNRRQPDLQTLIKLADYYKLTLDEIVGHEVPFLINKSQFSSKQLVLVEEVQSLSNEQCDKLLAYLDGLRD